MVVSFQFAFKEPELAVIQEEEEAEEPSQHQLRQSFEAMDTH